MNPLSLLFPALLLFSACQSQAPVESPFEPAGERRWLFVKAASAELLAAPRPSSPVVKNLRRHDRLAVLQRTRAVSNALLPDGALHSGRYFQVVAETDTGWVFEALVTYDEPSPEEQALLLAPVVVVAPYDPRGAPPAGWKESVSRWWESFRCSDDSEALADACDYLSTPVQELSKRLAGHAPGEFNVGQICVIYDSLLTCWHYVQDADDFPTRASSSIRNHFNGDCDDFAVLMASAMRAVGGDVRISYAAEDSRNGHAFAEVNLGSSEQKPLLDFLEQRYHTREFPGLRLDRSGNLWLNLDWWARPRRPGGKMFDYTRGETFYLNHNFCCNIFSNDLKVE